MTVLATALAAGALLLGGAPIVSAAPVDALAGPSARGSFEPRQVFASYWVAAHTATTLWSDPFGSDLPLGTAHQRAILQVSRPQDGDRLYVWNPGSEQWAWVDASDVGPIDPELAGTAYLPPIGGQVHWFGAARITMYTCIELGGCAPTASGLWPEPGMVAVDPRVIPLGARIWIEGLGTFFATDTGSLVRGAHIDVFSTSYREAIEWGVRTLPIIVFLD